MGNHIKNDYYDHYSDNDEENNDNSKCKDCNRKQISIKFKNTSIKLCNECYLKRKQQMLKFEIKMKGDIKINKITPLLYLGNNESAKDKKMLKYLEITHILVVGFFLHEYYPNSFIYKTIEIEDNESTQIINWFIPAFEFIEQAGKCLVHCRAGKSRSSSIVIAYLMYVGQFSYEQARTYVNSKHQDSEPNKGFVKQLQNFGDIFVKCQYNLKLIKNSLNISEYSIHN